MPVLHNALGDYTVADPNETLNTQGTLLQMQQSRQLMGMRGQQMQQEAQSFPASLEHMQLGNEASRLAIDDQKQELEIRQKLSEIASGPGDIFDHAAASLKIVRGRGRHDLADRMLENATNLANKISDPVAKAAAFSKLTGLDVKPQDLNEVKEVNSENGKGILVPNGTGGYTFHATPKAEKSLTEIQAEAQARKTGEVAGEGPKRPSNDFEAWYQARLDAKNPPTAQEIQDYAIKKATASTQLRIDNPNALAEKPVSKAELVKANNLKNKKLNDLQREYDKSKESLDGPMSRQEFQSRRQQIQSEYEDTLTALGQTVTPSDVENWPGSQPASPQGAGLMSSHGVAPPPPGPPPQAAPAAPPQAQGAPQLTVGQKVRNKKTGKLQTFLGLDKQGNALVQ